MSINGMSCLRYELNFTVFDDYAFKIIAGPINSARGEQFQ